jgi:hypothetical protein
MTTEREGELRGRIALITDVIASIEGAREELILSRAQVDSHEAARLDRLIEVNGEMLKRFKHSLAIATRDALKEGERSDMSEHDPVLELAIDRVIRQMPGARVNAVITAARECRLEMPRALKMEQLVECIRGKLEPTKKA